ncbi:hypothetical protein [Sedimentibacter saalensis]|uniref:hypothetical protein n=1 Tax=Sedimentibacter saalensis TaxID=130788 RepID=UPI0028987501|nr:hypothetical protein [Sedimentibacter saalensis]
MGIKEQILQELKVKNHQSDRELTDHILGVETAQQAINAACRQLALAGKLKRTAPPIKNYIDCGCASAQTALSCTTPTVQVERGLYLKKEFNDFWNDFWKTDKDYYSDFSLEKLSQLKMAVTNINNLITYETTIMAGKLICDILELNERDRTEIEKSIQSTSANSNGFDIEYHGEFPFICEVKANIPSGGKDVFGAQQINQLNKDVFSLLNGKSKSVIKLDALSNYHKFLCMYCNDVKTSNAIGRFVKSFNHKHGNSIEIWSGQDPLKKDKVYLFIVKEEV